jgi:SagB-type dehydrogenase family enzyme
VENPAQTLHRLTAYEPGREWTEPIDDPRIVQDLEVNDVSKLPWFYKRYPADLPRVPLPKDLPDTTAPTVSVLAGTARVSPRDLDIAQLGRLLFLSYGVVRTSERAYGPHLFRAAGSAGGRFPLELYAVIPAGSSLPAGVHFYDPLEHELVTIAPAPEVSEPAIVTTGVPWRSGWRYRERGYRHVYWDAGTMVSQLLAAADSAGVPASLFTRFPDAEVTSLVGADGVHEWPVAVVSLGDGFTMGAFSAATAGEIDAHPREFPLATEAQHAGDGSTWHGPWDFGPPIEVPGDGSAPVEKVILARGSVRRMDPAQSVSAETLTTSMAVAMRGIEVPHFVAVNAVDGYSPGLYRWPDLGTPVRAGLLRDELFRVSLEQGLTRDAAFVAIGAADVGSLGARDYREAQFAAGLVEGRLHILAYALGVGASGMTFEDSAMPEFLGEPLDGLLFTCVGVTDYRRAAGGKPGDPTPVRTPLGRD